MCTSDAVGVSFTPDPNAVGPLTCFREGEGGGGGKLAL